MTSSSDVAVSVTAHVAKLYDIHADHLGTPRMVTDSAGNSVWEWIGTPFGESLPNQNPGNTGAQNDFVMNLRFPGQVFDGETGLHYNYFRDYDPATGRYIESDPIGLKGGISTYGYVEQNPLTGIDPLGLQAISPTITMPTFDSAGKSIGNFRPEVKKYLCDLVKKCNGNQNCLFTESNKDRQGKDTNGGNINPKTWHDPTLREAENFSTAASGKGDGWGANAIGITIWQLQKVIPRGKTSPFSMDAWYAGMAGREFYKKPPADLKKWCEC